MKTVTGIDIGSYAVRLVQGHDKKGVFVPTAFHSELRAGEGAEESLEEAATAVALRSSGARIGVTGRDAMFRFVQVPDTGDAQLRKFLQFEIAELSEQSGGDIVGGFNVLHAPTMSDDLTVMIALAKESLLESCVQHLKGTKLRVRSFSPNAVGLFNAYLRSGRSDEGPILLASIGEENVDVVIASGTDLYFARNLSGGTRFFLEALRDSFRVSTEKARQLLREACELDPAKKGQLTSPTQEKVTQSLYGAAGQLASLLQSAVMFGRSQAQIQDLQIKNVLLCGGGARIQGLCAYLSGAMNKPVALFDPFDEMDLSQLPDEQWDLLDAQRLESVTALGLALTDSFRDLYQLDVIPPSLERRRNLLQRTSFLVGAGGLAILFLVLDYDRAAQTRAIFEAGARRQTAQVNELVGADERAVASLNRYGELWQKAARIEPWLQGGTALLAASEIVHSVLPEDLYVSRAELLRAKPTGKKSSEGFSRDERPIVIVGIKHLQRSEKLIEQRRRFIDGLQRPGLFRAEQCRPLEGGAVPSSFKDCEIVLQIDPFLPLEPSEEEESTGGEETAAKSGGG